MVMDRYEDMKTTGHRHSLYTKYKVGGVKIIILVFFKIQKYKLIMKFKTFAMKISQY